MGKKVWAVFAGIGVTTLEEGLKELGQWRATWEERIGSI